jgi:hypothetical protein
MHLSATKLWGDNNNFGAFIWGYPIGYIFFWVFTLSVRAKHFQMDQNKMKDECTYSQHRNSAYVDGVYMILILRA